MKSKSIKYYNLGGYLKMKKKIFLILLVVIMVSAFFINGSAKAT